MEPLSSLLFAALLASLFAIPLRHRDQRGSAALLSGGLSAAAMAWGIAPGSLWVLAGFLVGAALGWGARPDPSARLATPFGGARGLFKTGGALPGALPNPGDVLDPAGRLRLERAIYAVDQQAEIVVAVVGRCDSYLGARWRFALTVAASTWLGLGIGLPEVPLWALFVAQIAALAAAFLATAWPPLARLLVPGSSLDAAVQGRARRAFFEAGLHHAACGAAAMIFVATLERRFALLADDGTSPAGAEPDRWEGIGAALRQAFRGGQGVLGLEEAVGACAAEIARAVSEDGARYRDLALLKASVVIEDEERGR